MEPYIVEESDDYAVVFKPAKMHSTVNLTRNNNLLDWYRGQCPNVFDLMHRLDYETQGLVLFAKNQSSYQFFKTLQNEGKFVKEYSALCEPAAEVIEGFPPLPACLQLQCKKNLLIESYFRPFGPGRKQVRPVIEDGKKHREITNIMYRTEITGIDGNHFTIRISRGFRHQIRCHLRWIGFPVQNDPLYSQSPLGELALRELALRSLALRSHALFFADPGTGQTRECRISPFIIS
jgi:23S rRNA pseudouridine1911/1915/1917 synthase